MPGCGPRRLWLIKKKWRAAVTGKVSDARKPIKGCIYAYSLSLIHIYIYVKKGSIDNPYGDDADHTFTLQAPEGIDEMTVTLNKHPSDDVDEGGNVIDTEPITENLSNLLIKLRNQSENGSTMNVDDYIIRVTVKVVKVDQSYSYTRKYKHTGIYSYYYTLDDNVTRYSFIGAEGDTALRLINMATREERTVTKNDASTLYLSLIHIEMCIRDRSPPGA